MNKVEFLANKYIFSRFFSNEGTRKVLNNAAWILFDKVLKITVGLFVGVWVARYLGPAEFAKLNYTTVFVGLFTPLATLSIDSLVVRELAQKPHRKNEILGTAFLLRFVASILSFFAILLFSFILESNDLQMVIYVSLMGSVLIFQSVDMIDFYFQSQLKSKYSIYVRIISYVLLSGVKIGLIITKAPLLYFIVAYFAELSIGSVGLVLIYIFKQNKLSDWKFDKELNRFFLQNSLVLMLQSFALVAQTKIDQIILKNLIGNQELGQYAVAIRLIELLVFIPMAIYSSVAPRIAEAKINDEKLYQLKLGQLYGVMFQLFLMMGLGIMILGSPFVKFLYGNEYQQAGFLFSIMSFRLFFTNMGLARSVFLVNENMFQFSLLSVIIGALLNIGFNLLLIPYYQSVGAVFSTIISFTISTFLLDLFHHKTRKNLFYMIRSAFSFKYAFNKNNI